MILLLEDSDADAELVFEQLKRSDDEELQLVRARTLREAIEYLYERQFSIIITDLSLSDTIKFDEAVVKLSSTHPTIPLIVLSNHDELDSLLALGAQEVVSKNNLHELTSAVRRALLRKKADTNIRHRLVQDSLTGLINRARFMELVERAVIRFKRHGEHFCVLYIDLDNFKPVNDVHGHQIGDQVLKEVGKRLQTVVRELEVIARIGGDEFAILAETANPALIAERVLKALAQPIILDANSFQIGASIGYTLAEPNVTARDMIEAADAAMYKAKRDGGMKYYSSSPQPRGDYENEVTAALDRKEFYLVYQKQICHNTEQVCGIECLMRWNRPGRNRSKPDDFIPVLENTGEIVRVGEWIISSALDDYQKLTEKFHNAKLSINISPQQLDYDLVSFIKKALHERSIKPENLTLEITEYVLLHDSSSVKQQLEKLRKLGIHLSLDDFGIGYSSLAALLKAPINELKIDKTFINALPGEQAKKLIGAVVDLGKRLDARVVAEGVETEEQSYELKNLGVQILQGYLYGHPFSLE